MPETLKSDHPTVESQVETLPRWRRRIEIRVPAEHARLVRQRYVTQFARHASLKGFRPGKAPLRLVEQKYGDEITREVLKDLIREGFEAGVSQESLQPVGAPTVEGVRWTPEGALEFVAEIDVEPEVELSRTTGFRVERKVRHVTDQDVERVLERLRADRAEWPPVERPAADGDRIVFDSVPLDVHGEPIEAERVENHRVDIGQRSLLPDFEEGLRGRSAGETAEIEVAFPEDHPNEMLRGRTRRFRVSVDTVQERALPDLDDEFARTVGDFDSLEALRAHIRENLEEEIEQQSRREIDEALIDEIIDANRIEVPESLIDRYLASMIADPGGPLQGRVPAEKLEEVRRVLRPGAERAVRRYYILREIARAESLEVADDELDRAIAERIDPERISTAEARRRLERSGELDDLRHHLTMERVFEWLRQRSKIEPVDASG